MKLPETISVHAGAGRPEGFGELLIADFCDATRAYARLSHMKEPAFVASDAAGGSTAGAYVAALSLDELMARAEKAPGFAPDTPSSTPAYFIIYAPSDELSENLNENGTKRTTRALGFVYAMLESICSKSGRELCGVLLVGHAELLAAKFAGPRMGFWRRRTSEGMDRLIAAARTGMSVAAYEQIASLDGTRAGRKAKIASRPKAGNASERTSTDTAENDERIERHTNPEGQSASATNAPANRSIIDVTNPFPWGLAKLLNRTVAR